MQQGQVSLRRLLSWAGASWPHFGDATEGNGPAGGGGRDRAFIRWAGLSPGSWYEEGGRPTAQIGRQYLELIFQQYYANPKMLSAHFN